MSSNTIDLSALSYLKDIFDLFNSGKYLNRANNAALWFELEQNREQYQTLFVHLGFDLQIDKRGFAWFHDTKSNSEINKQSQQLALLIMIIFDYQADHGHSLGQFQQWSIDNNLLAAVYEKHKGLLDAEDIQLEGLKKLLDSAANRGFARQENYRWQFLPAVYRYLDHFEAIASQNVPTPNLDEELQVEEEIEEC